MKTRTDFVSNSSSCSFIISIGKNFPLNDFIDEACKGCLKHVDEDDSETFVNSQDEFNHAVLNYHLRASELLFLGELNLGLMQSTFTKDDDCFSYLKDDIDRCGIASNERVVESTDEKVVVEYNDTVTGMAIQKHEVAYVTGEYHWSNDYSYDIEIQKKAAKEIFDFAKNYSDSKTDYKCRYDSSTYFISRSTIWNTRALIAAGYKLDLDDWMDLDKLDKMIQDGDKVIGVRVNNGGDGVDEDALFTFGGWDGEDVFNDMSGIDILHSETM